MRGVTSPTTAAGQACAWCGKPAARLVTARPPDVKSDGSVIDFAITAAACGGCADRLAEQPEHVDTLRRRHARDVPQTRLFQPRRLRDAGERADGRIGALLTRSDTSLRRPRLSAHE
jgi:hypothetical protein